MEDTQLAARHIALREKANLTQEQEAKKAGVSPTTISGIESGKITRPHLRTLIKLAKALGVQPEELTERELPKDLAPQLPLEPELTEAERIEELRGFAKLINGLNKRWAEEAQQNLANGYFPFGWAIAIESAAMGLLGIMREIPTIGGRDEIELGLSQEEQQAKLEVSKAVEEMLRIANRAEEVERSLEEHGERLPESMIATRKRHLAALRSIA